MIGRRKFRLSRVSAFKQPGRMRHADEKHRVLACFYSCVVKCTAGMLFENVVNVLDTREIALPDTIQGLIKPADRGSQRNAVIPNFSFAL